tara:strand:- start:14 stop:673 length:660 start_codon:yes stop_codon:yes gene_type:complete
MQMKIDSVRKTKKTTTVRKHERGAYDRNTVYSIIDSTPLCHVSYIIDDWPYVTPTIQWREDNRIFWHGSSASRFLRQIADRPACLAVTHFDGIVLARSASHHSANYRSVMLFGTAEALKGKEKDQALESFMDSMFPNRWSQLRPMTETESKSTAVLSMIIDEGSAKVRTGHSVDEKDDYSLPIWAGIIPIVQQIGTPEPDPKNLHGLSIPEHVSEFKIG